MKILSDKKGFTLIEIIISLAILGIIVVSFTTTFTSSFSGIFSSGKKSQALHQAQIQMDRKINSVTTGSDTLNIKFLGISQITVLGKKEIVNVEYKDHNVSLTTFIPNR
ncbi:type IV pilus modification PilV family protein [Crassaminicella profunda]|uniref:type IV pilus modification PilV family protein n=1 Tax=Crassaminicella profunda TaxID=1286698 RepID=UPI001CA67ECA|nr:type II secretion system protein [Crassaminicella profunda]QZY56983.1 type II secretion system GspH family protein [Crassaminicella profunda]